MLELEALDHAGSFTVKSGEGRYPARLLDDVTTLFVGQIVRVRMQLNAPSNTRPGGDTLEVAGRITAIRDDAGWGIGRAETHVRLVPGLEVRIEALRTSLSSSNDGPSAAFMETSPRADIAPYASDVASDEDPTLQPGVNFEPTGVVGNLREMQLAEIVQTLSHGHKDAIVDVKPKDATPGVIHVVGGNVVHATCGEQVGHDAFFTLLPATQGMFRIHYGKKSHEQTIFADTTYLLLEAARRSDEGAHAPDPVDLAVAASPILPPNDGPTDPFAGVPEGAVPAHIPLSLSAAFLLDDSNMLGAVSFVQQLAFSTPPVFAGDTGPDHILEISAKDLVAELDGPEDDLVLAAAADDKRVVKPLHSPFARFFDEAGVDPGPAAAFSSAPFLSLRRDVAARTSDDPDAMDSEITARHRRTPSGRIAQ